MEFIRKTPEEVIKEITNLNVMIRSLVQEYTDPEYKERFSRGMYSKSS